MCVIVSLRRSARRNPHRGLPFDATPRGDIIRRRHHRIGGHIGIYERVLRLRARAPREELGTEKKEK